MIMETCSKLRRYWSRRRAGQSQVLHTSAHRKSVPLESESFSKVVGLKCVANSNIISTTSVGSSRSSVVILVFGDPVETRVAKQFRTFPVLTAIKDLPRAGQSDLLSPMFIDIVVEK